MENNAPYNEQEFENAEQEMNELLQNSLKGKEVPVNAMFLKLGDFVKARASGLLKWSMEKSLWPLQFGLACCAMELMDFGAARIDAERKGYLLFRGTPRQCDVMIVAGWVTKSMVPRVK